MSFWAVDTHVHIPRPPAAASAFESFAAAARRLGKSPEAGVMLLADTVDQDGIQSLAHNTPRGPDQRVWTYRQDDDAACLISEGPPFPLLAVGGFQVVSCEGLEVLGLMMRERPADGRPLRQTIETILGAGGLPVLPWGVGKWLGSRGRMVADLIGQMEWRGRIAFADNANRPTFWPTPSLLRRAREAGFAVLHGSDPLPLSGDVRRVGSAGVTVPAGPLDAPVAFLRHILCDPTQVQVFGNAMPAAGFMYRQAAIRLGASA